MSLLETQIAVPRAAREAPPASAVPLADGLSGLAGLTAAWLLMLAVKPPALLAVVVLLLAVALPMLVRELRRAPALPAAGRSGTPVLTWALGFVLAATPFYIVHAQAGRAGFWLIAWGIVAPAFGIRLWLEFRRNRRLAPGLPGPLGQALLALDRGRLRALAAPARLWTLKAFFIPIYAASLYALVWLALGLELSGPLAWLTLLVLFAYTVDLGFALAGYVFASNDLVPTVRSTQTRVLGWIACLACYGPVFAHWPAFEYVVTREISWTEWVANEPLLLAGAGLMLVLLALYASATVCFGLRFSNLTNRGLVSGGPYRLMKHPAYFAHAANAWIITCIFMPAAGIELGLSQLLVPVAFTVLYRLRAVTEEQHMREDPAYVEYEAWIARHGLLARLLRLTGLRRPA